MSEKVEDSDIINQEMQAVAERPKDDVVEREDTQTSASVKPEQDPKVPDHHIPQKKRKTRRGKSKRKQPYMKSRIPNVIKPEAPHNSNQFLLEDHCDFENLDERLLNKTKGSIFNRNRDSSFSVDSDGEFYSSPDDEEQFLIKDFDNQYETVHAEHLNNMSKPDLIQEYLSLEKKVELLSNILRKRTEGDYDRTKIDLQMEIQQLKSDNESLKQQNQELLSKLSNKSNSSSSDSSSDSESDSSSSSSSSVSSCDMNESELLNNSSNNMDNRKCVNLSS